MTDYKPNITKSIDNLNDLEKKSNDLESKTNDLEDRVEELEQSGGGGGGSQELTDFINSIILMDCDEVTPTIDVQTQEGEIGGQWYRLTQTTTSYKKEYNSFEEVVEDGRSGILDIINGEQLSLQKFYYKKNGELQYFGGTDEMETEDYTTYTHTITSLQFFGGDTFPVKDYPSHCVVVFKNGGTYPVYSIELVWVEERQEPIPAPNN